MLVTGDYCVHGYVISVDGIEEYRAGNSPYDSQQYLSRDQGVGYETMGKYCRIEAKRLAQELGNSRVDVVGNEGCECDEIE